VRVFLGVRHAEFEILDTNLYKNGLFLGEIARYQLEVRSFTALAGRSGWWHGSCEESKWFELSWANNMGSINIERTRWEGFYGNQPMDETTN
jgi:hypothetical protein